MTGSLGALPKCRICGAESWTELYRGPVRLGGVGTASPEARLVGRCGGCGAGYLDSPPVDYESAEYRELVDGSVSVARFYELHDAEQATKLSLVGSAALREKVVADIGCGAGSFLDLVRGAASATVAIEPTRAYHPALTAKGHRVYPLAAGAAGDWGGKVHLAVCFSVVEHVPDPVALLRDIRALLVPGGELVLSTPNLRDWMLEQLPEDYGRFFFRAVHTWYFDRDALEALARAAEFKNCVVRSVHRFDLANALVWLRDRRPAGRGAVRVGPTVDAAFVRWLEETDRADYLYARLTP
jgi:SAM-dependent methyltransferase